MNASVLGPHNFNILFNWANEHSHEISICCDNINSVKVFYDDKNCSSNFLLNSYFLSKIGFRNRFYFLSALWMFLPWSGNNLSNLSVPYEIRKFDLHFISTFIRRH